MTNNHNKTILFVNWQDIKNPDAGGAELHLHETTKRLVKKGYRCILYCHHFKNAPPFENIDGIEVYRIGNRFSFSLTVWLNYKKWCQKHSPDVVIDDCNKIPFFLSKLSTQRVLVRCHHLFGRSIFSQTIFPIALIIYTLEKLAVKSWKNLPVLTVSPSTKDELSKKGILHISIIYNGIDLNLYKKSKPKKQNHLLYVGRLMKYKQVSTLLLALIEVKKRYPDIKLDIAGKGNYQHKLQQECKILNLDQNVIFHGFVTEKQKVALYSQATISLNASLKEGWGLTSIEANACSTIVIGSNVPGLKDSIIHNKTGFLVPAKNPKKFATKILDLLDNPKNREKIELEALQWSKKFNWDIATKNLEKKLWE